MYRYRREDTGEIVELDFDTHMRADCAGYVTLPDGVTARRVNDFRAAKPSAPPPNVTGVPLPSDNLGFTVRQLKEFEDHRQREHITGVEFKPDPMCPTFYQVHFDSYEARDRYIKARGKVDLNRTSGAALTAKDLADAAERARNIGN